MKPPLYLLPALLLAVLLTSCPGPLDSEPEPELLEKPVITSVLSGNASLTVNWEAVANADSYELYYDDEDTPPEAESPASITDVTGTTTTINNLENDKTYYVWLRAKNGSGVSEYSESVSGTPIAANINSLTLEDGWYKGRALPPYDDGYEKNDETFIYYGNGSKQINFEGRALKYDADSKVLIIQVSKTSEYNPTVGKYYGVFIGDITPFSFTGSNAYKSGGNNDGMDTLDDAIAEYTADNEYFGIKAGYGLYAGVSTVNASNTSLEVSWTAVPGATKYDVYYTYTKTPPTSDTVPITAGVTIDGTTATITGLDNGMPYKVWVRAKDDDSHTGAWVYQGSGTPVLLQGLTLPDGTYKSAALPSDVGGYGNDWYTIESGTIAYYYEGDQNFSGQEVSYNNDVVIIKITETSEYGPTVDKYYGVYIGDITPFSFTGANAYKSGGNNDGMDTLDEAIAEYTKAKEYFEIKTGFGHYAGTATVTGIDTGLEVSWPAVPGAAGYEVYHQEASNKTPPTSATDPITTCVSINGTTATITGLTNDTAYNVWVRAKDDDSHTGAWVYQGSGTPEALVFSIAGYFKGDYIPWDDGIGLTASHFYQYDDGALGISYGGDIVKHIPAGTDGKAGTIIIKITEAGTWGKTVGSYYAVDYKNYGYSTTMEVVRIQTSSANKTDGANNGVPTLAEAITEYTIANGYFVRYGNYRQFRNEVPQADSSLTLTGLEGAWSGKDGDDADYFIRIANPVLTWSSDLESTAIHQFAGTIVETTNATANSWYIYIKVDFVNTASGDYDDLEVDNYFAIHWKEKADGSIKLCAAYGDNKNGTATLDDAKTTYTVDNDYFDDDYYVVLTPPPPSQ